MPFPLLAAVGLAGQLGGMAGGIYNLIQGPGADGRGKIKRFYDTASENLRRQQAYSTEAADAARAASDYTSPLFRQTMMIEESRLRRSASEGVQQMFLQARKQRARGLTAGVRPEREDEGRFLALGGLFQQASEQAATTASQRLSERATLLENIARGIGAGAGTAANAAGQATQTMATNVGIQGIRTQQRQSAFDILGAAGGMMGGLGGAEGSNFAQLFGGGGGGGGFGFGQMFAPQAQPTLYWGA